MDCFRHNMHGKGCSSCAVEVQIRVLKEIQESVENMEKLARPPLIMSPPESGGLDLKLDLEPGDIYRMEEVVAHTEDIDPPLTWWQRVKKYWKESLI